MKKQSQVRANGSKTSLPPQSRNPHARVIPVKSWVRATVEFPTETFDLLKKLGEWGLNPLRVAGLAVRKVLNDRVFDEIFAWIAEQERLAEAGATPIVQPPVENRATCSGRDVTIVLRHPAGGEVARVEFSEAEFACIQQACVKLGCGLKGFVNLAVRDFVKEKTVKRGRAA
jgi:hypothetical protein